jgi:hypothetical protein
MNKPVSASDLAPAPVAVEDEADAVELLSLLEVVAASLVI